VSESILASSSSPPGSVIQLYTGVTGFILVLSYIIMYTIPNWNTLVTQNIKNASGSIIVIVVTYMGLILSAFLHAWSHLKLVKHTGSVSTAILQSLRAIFVFFLSSMFFCGAHPEQCINIPKIASAVVVVFGVSYFTYLQKIDQASKLSKEKNETINV